MHFEITQRSLVVLFSLYIVFYVIFLLVFCVVCKLCKSFDNKRSCNAINDLSYRVWIPNKTEDLNLSVFNMITDANESKTLAKHISCECKCKFHGTKCKSNKNCNSNKCWCECKKIHICQKYYVWVLLPVLIKMENI